MKKQIAAFVFAAALTVSSAPLFAQSDTMPQDKKMDSGKSKDHMSGDKMSDGKMSGDHMGSKDSKMPHGKKSKKKSSDTMANDTH